MTNQDCFRPAKIRLLHSPQPDTIRLWTIQPLPVWNALQNEGTLLVDPEHPDFADSLPYFRDAYAWMRGQMARRIPDYTGHYPWWAYTHFLDLRLYRWYTPQRGKQYARLELAVPKEQALLSIYDRWHSVLNRWYLPEGFDDETAYDRESNAWRAEATRDGVDVYRHKPFAEPWEAQMQASWQRIFDVEAQRPAEIIQAVFERLELAQVVQVTEFTSATERKT